MSRFVFAEYWSRTDLQLKMLPLKNQIFSKHRGDLHFTLCTYCPSVYTVKLTTNTLRVFFEFTNSGTGGGFWKL